MTLGHNRDRDVKSSTPLLRGLVDFSFKSIWQGWLPSFESGFRKDLAQSLI